MTLMRCRVCLEDKPADHFACRSDTRSGRDGRCRECRSSREAELRVVRHGGQEGYREHMREQVATHRANDPSYYRKRYEEARLAMLTAYGGACACCGERRLEFLTLDHIDGVPEHHRWPNGKRIMGADLYRRVAAEGFPDDYQLLCWNCNAAKGIYGECPHVAERRERAAS